jgi:hypothetical protein
MEQSTFCCLCSGTTPFKQQIVVMPCNHVLCFPCMIESQAAAIYNPPFKCPIASCGVIIERHSLLVRDVQSRATTRGSVNHDEQVRKEFCYSDYHPKKGMMKLRESCDGIRIEMNSIVRMSPESRKTYVKDGLLVTAQAKISLVGHDVVPKCDRTSFSIVPRKEGIIGPKHLNELVKLFYNFHSIFIATASTRGPDYSKDSISLSKLILLIAQDRRPLFYVCLLLLQANLILKVLTLAGWTVSLKSCRLLLQPTSCLVF